MDKRNKPYRQKIPMEFLPLIESASALKLYLVQEHGPTSFVFKDDEGEKYKVSIGPTISCSCSKSMDHCAHTFYVMLKIFKRDQKDPLIWQNSFIDNEINELIKSRFEPQSRANPPKKNFLQRQKKELLSLKSRPRPQRLEIDGESLCPICQESLDSNDQALTFCKKKCGNNFHIKCIKVWVQHKISTKDPITCPMCRIDWGAGVLEEISREEDFFYHRFIIHKGKNCQTCNMKPIKGNLYHCLYCKNYDLCEACYKSFQHLMHNKFLMKARNDGEWVPAFNREKEYIRGDKNNGLLNFCHNFANYENFKPENLIFEVFENQNNEKLNNNKGKAFADLNDFLVDSIPNLENSLNENPHSALNGLQIVGVELMTIRNSCVVCNENHPKMKKLFCGHTIDKVCLKNLLNHSKFQCPSCGSLLMDGLSVFSKEKVEEIKQKPLATIPKKKSLPKRSNTLEHKHSVLKTLQSNEKNRLEIVPQNLEENKHNKMSNLEAGRMISELRNQTLERKMNSMNKFRINRKAGSHKDIATVGTFRRKENVEEFFELIGNKCPLNKN